MDGCGKPFQLQPIHKVGKTGSFLTNEVGRRDLYLIKRKLRGVRGMPSHFFYFMGMHARSMPIDEQQADAFAAFVGPGLYGRNKEVSAIPIRNKSFRA